MKLCIILGTFVVCASSGAPRAGAADRPNVILIMTDDQGYGDLGVHGNPVVQTPHIDAMASRSAVLKYFYVSPVCTPTRASLMTGRYNYRTRAIDTYRGRAMMDPDETTVAELLRDAGYATGIFGKWHLGDTYPSRAMDQGFDHALVHRGGGIGQPSDPPGGEGKYTDPVLFQNGRAVRFDGYCTDIFFREGMKWAETAVMHGRPFFLYLPTNAPHAPLDDVPRDKYEWYRHQTISPDRFPSRVGHPVARDLNPETQARVYAMISNIDENVGRLFAWLDEHDLAQHTLVLFMTDNGSATSGYSGGLRGRKADVYEGGIRSPFFACWPDRLEPGTGSDAIAAHIDVMPTLLEACGIALPRNLRLDGRSLWPVLRGQETSHPDRTLYFQAHRGDAPVRYHQFAVRTARWKLLHNSGFGAERLPPGELQLELFDMINDPFETQNAAAGHPDVVAQLKASYEDWFRDVSSTRPDNYAPPRIQLGTPHEDPVVLTRQDWRGAGWGPKDRGHWEVLVTEPGSYDFQLSFPPVASRGTAILTIGEVMLSRDLAEGSDSVAYPRVKLTSGPATIQAEVVEAMGRRGVMFVEVSRHP